MIQEVDSTIIPTGSHKTYFSVERAALLLSGNRFQFSPFSSSSKVELYGKEFTKEVFLDIFSSFMSIYAKVSSSRKVLPSVMKYFEYFNGITEGEIFEQFSTGPSLSEVNGVIDDLGFTEIEMERLLWEKDQTVKEWFNLLYLKIKNSVIDGKDGSLKNGLEELALIAGASHPEFQEIDIQTDKKYFTVEESRFCQVLFKHAINIFGHFTLLLMLSKMLKSSDSGLLVTERPIYTELEEIYKQIYLVPATKGFDVPMDAIYLAHYNHLFGAFFLGSHMYLPIKGEGYSKASYSKLQFPVGPMVCFDEDIHLAARRLSLSPSSNLKYSIGNAFQRVFEEYIASPYFVVREFLRTQDNVINHFRKLIIKNIGLRYSSKAVSKWITSSLILGTRLGLTYGQLDSRGFKNIRNQIENAIKNGDSTLLLDLMLSKPSGGENFKIWVDMIKFLENDIRIWGGTRIVRDNIDTVKARETLTNTINLLGVLKSMVSVLGDDGKVRLFPLYDTEDVSLGYQFLVPSQSSNKYITDIPSQGYFDVDVATDEGIFTLIHAINMMYSGKFAFVMKKPDGTLNDGEMICAFNREGFLQPDEIFSLGSASGIVYRYRKFDHFIAYRMVITKLSTIFIGKDEEWLNYWSFGGGWSSTHSNLKNDYYAYHNYIQDIDMDASKKQNNYVRAYLIQLESRFNGFIPFIQEILGI